MCSVFLSSTASGSLQNNQGRQVCCDVQISITITSADHDPTQQPTAARENTSLPLQETDPNCSGVIRLKGHDILVQK